MPDEILEVIHEEETHDEVILDETQEVEMILETEIDEQMIQQTIRMIIEIDEIVTHEMTVGEVTIEMSISLRPLLNSEKYKSEDFRLIFRLSEREIL